LEQLLLKALPLRPLQQLAEPQLLQELLVQEKVSTQQQ
jgi:hypothetical protein